VQIASAASPSPHAAVTLAELPTDRRTLAQRLRRCMSVSVVTTVISLSTLVIATAAFGMAAWPANVLATSLATVPSYLLNRRWTWGRRDASSFWREVVPFWVMAFAGLALSTVFVGVADSWAAGAHLSGALHTFSLVAGHLSGFGVLWVAQFIVLDRLVFARPIGASS
jgi:putative flippase GtrA